MGFHPYLFFSNGTCREAFERYHEILGGELSIMANSEAPPGEGMPGADPSGVMHAALTVGDALLMGSDDPTGDGGAKAGIAVSYSAADEADAARVFEALAEGGEVQMPFAAVFWSKGFGACVDRFGIPWMVDAGDPEPPAG
jgi:PhnB protein